MNEKRLFRIIGDVDEDLVEAADSLDKPRPAMKLVLRWSALAACLLLVLGIGFGLGGNRTQPITHQLPETASSQPPEIQEPAITRADIEPFSSPAGVRKFFNYGGYRYAFMDDGAPFDLPGTELTNALGTLEHDILAGMDGFGDNEAAALDRSTTFALGGEIWEISSYDPAYRLAVVWEGETYLAELVGRVDGEPLDIARFFTVSGIASRVTRVDILPHMGGEPLRTVDGADADTLISLLSAARPASMTEDDYLAVADAQLTGRSWQLALRLDDGTSLHIYLIPDLGLVSIGDSTYALPDSFGVGWGSHFDGLTQNDLPLY